MSANSVPRHATCARRFILHGKPPWFSVPKARAGLRPGYRRGSRPAGPARRRARARSSSSRNHFAIRRGRRRKGPHAHAGREARRATEPRPELAHGVSFLRHRLPLQERISSSVAAARSTRNPPARACAAARARARAPVRRPDEARAQRCCSVAAAADDPRRRRLRRILGVDIDGTARAGHGPQAMRDAGSDAKFYRSRAQECMALSKRNPNAKQRRARPAALKNRMLKNPSHFTSMSYHIYLNGHLGQARCARPGNAARRVGARIKIALGGSGQTSMNQATQSMRRLRAPPPEQSGECFVPHFTAVDQQATTNCAAVPTRFSQARRRCGSAISGQNSWDLNLPHNLEDAKTCAGWKMSSIAASRTAI